LATARQDRTARDGVALEQVPHAATVGRCCHPPSNGYKIANPTILARISREELDQLLRGYGWTPYYVVGHEPAIMHQAMGATLDAVVEDIRRIQTEARERGDTERPRWPMIVFGSPKGWTGPKAIDGVPNEGTFRSHQVRFRIGYEP